jgi:hypothetical protein
LILFIILLKGKIMRGATENRPLILSFPGGSF